MSNVTLAEEHRRCDRLFTSGSTDAWRRFPTDNFTYYSRSRSSLFWPILDLDLIKDLRRGVTHAGSHDEMRTVLLFFYVTLHFITTKFDLIYSLEACTSSLGLENGQIRDKQISASSELEKKQAAKQGRVSLSSFPQDRCDIRLRLVPF